MANTEILAVLERVRTAKNAVGTLRFDKTLSQSDQDLIGDAYVTLDEVENKLILQDIKQWIDEISADGNALKKLAAKIGKSIAKLKAVAQKIQDAAVAIGALAGILAKAASSGLL